MAPAARKFKEFDLSESQLPKLNNNTSDSNDATLSIAHNASKAVNIFDDWMIFTNMLGIGIINRIS